MQSNKYTPDLWAVVHVGPADNPHYRILASWYGGYTGSDSWKLSSGVNLDKTYMEGETVHFVNHSGSVYSCVKNRYGMSGLASSVLSNLQSQVKSCDTTTLCEVLSYEDALTYLVENVH